MVPRLSEIAAPLPGEERDEAIRAALKIALAEIAEQGNLTGAIGYTGSQIGIDHLALHNISSSRDSQENLPSESGFLIQKKSISECVGEFSMIACCRINWPL